MHLSLPKVFLWELSLEMTGTWRSKGGIGVGGGLRWESFSKADPEAFKFYQLAARVKGSRLSYCKQGFKVGGLGSYLALGMGGLDRFQVFRFEAGKRGRPSLYA